jgi:hypothetical protein
VTSLSASAVAKILMRIVPMLLRNNQTAPDAKPRRGPLDPIVQLS